MNRRWTYGLGAVGLALLASAALAVNGPVDPSPMATADCCDVLLLADGGPVRLRLRVEAEGKSLAAREDEYYRRLFGFYHSKGKIEDELTPAEAARAVRGDPLRRLLSSHSRPFRLADLDADGNGRVSLAEFAEYCRTSRRIFQVEVLAFRDPYSDRLTQALFTALDRDKDGKLSRAEVKAAPAVLAELDRDEDECLVPLELAPDLFRTAAANTPIVGGNGVLVVQTGDAAAAREKLLERYGKEAEGKVDAWLKAPPDFEAAVHLGSSTVADRVALNGAEKARPERAVSVHPKNAGRLVLRIGDAQLDVATRGPGDAFEAAPGWTPDALRRSFRKADSRHEGSVEAAALTDESFKPLRNVLPFADHDGDGKLTARELDAYLDLQKLAQDGVVTLTVANRPRGWFEILDADHDGRLSVRELRNAWDRLADADAEKTGFLTLPPQAKSATITLSRGRTLDRGQALFLPANPPAATRGPLWFRKMDRNGDGDVSRREFIGTPEDSANSTETETASSAWTKPRPSTPRNNMNRSFRELPLASPDGILMML